uniref:Lipase maturation factor n=1 Tax=Amphimedon queenslandica TaxID=400682 RepID=A0A1X7TE66_AMPQE
MMKQGISYCTLLEQTAPRKKLAPTNSLIPSKYSREHRQYSFGWESQLLEMGFLAMFLSPVLSLSQFSRHTPTSWTNVWGNCWMIFRIIIGAVKGAPAYDKCQHHDTIRKPSQVGDIDNYSKLNMGQQVLSFDGRSIAFLYSVVTMEGILEQYKFKHYDCTLSEYCLIRHCAGKVMVQDIN